MRGAAPFGRGRFYLTDVNFVRLVDFHNSARQDLRILLPRNRKTYLLRWQARVGNNWVDKWEWEIPTGSRVVHLDRLRGGLPGTTFKGSIRPLLANLFALPHDQAVVDNYQPADIELLVREATFEASPVNRIILRYGLANGFLAEASVTSRVTLGYMRRVGKLELGWLVGYGGAGYQRDDGVVVDYHEMLTHGALTYRPLWRDRWSLLMGLEAGFSWGWQSGSLGSQTRTISSALFRWSAVLGGDYRLHDYIYILLQAHAGQAVHETRDGIHSPFIGGFNAGVSLRL